ncbi:MAG: hypothetical protein J7L73_01930 [Anaerolineales bacterium]|nr:hypothetical protein [Anaerolineales bacterium]
MKSQRGSTDCPRYWITLEKEIIWDYPRDFVGSKGSNRAGPECYPHVTDIADISNLIRVYIDTPRGEIMTREFAADHLGLVDVLRAADKRIGARRLPELSRTTGSQAAQAVIVARLGLSLPLEGYKRHEKQGEYDAQYDHCR